MFSVYRNIEPGLRARFLIGAASLCMACVPMQPSAAARQPDASKGYNFIIVCLDTLRADHVGSYGYSRQTTPCLDALAQDAIRFEWAIAQSNFTLPSHASLFTSQYVCRHGVDRIERSLAPAKQTLAEILKENGFATAAFIHNAVQLDPVFGLDQGFDTYDYSSQDNHEISFMITLPRCVQWIGQHRKDRFFVFLHSNDIHEPYHCPQENFFDPGYKGPLDKQYLGAANRSFHADNLKRSARDRAHIIAHYDAGIRYADSFIGELAGYLKRTGLYERTVIIVLSDHGEVLADRGSQFLHGFSLHDEEVRVPLVMRIPGNKEKGVVISRQVELIDVMPTILDLAGIDTGRPPMDGKSLVALINDPASPSGPAEFAYAECVSGESQQYGFLNTQKMVRTLGGKLIFSSWSSSRGIADTGSGPVQMWNGAFVMPGSHDSFALYRLDDDPHETRDLWGSGDDMLATTLLQRMLRFE